MEGDFRAARSAKERRAEARRLRDLDSTRVPVVIEKARATDRLNTIPRSKFLTPYDLTVGQLMYVVRKHVRLPASQALFLFVCQEGGGRDIPPAAALVGEVFERHQWDDGFLYMSYCEENAFG